jgi:hypothetical protein
MAENKTRIVITAQDNTRGPLNAVKTNLGGLDGAARSLQGSLATLGVGFGAVQTVRFFKGIIDGADEMGKLAQKTNMAVEQVAGWTHALDLAGVSQGALQKTAKALGTQMLDASRGLAEAKDNFAALDIDIKNNDGSLKSLNAVLLEVADRYANATDKTAAAALMNKVLGKSALDLIPAFKDGRAALEAMIAEGQRYNPITEESARQAEAFNDNLQRLSKSIKSDFIVAMNSSLPALAEMSENMVRASKEGITFLGVLRELAKVDLALLGTLFPSLEGLTQRGFNALAAQDGTILRPGEVTGKIGGLPAAKPAKPFTPKTSGSDAAKAARDAAKEYAWLMKQLQEGEDEWQKTYTEAWKAWEKTVKGTTEGAAAAVTQESQQAIAGAQSLGDATKGVTDEMTEFWKSAAQAMQSSMSDLFFDVMQGELSDLADSFKKTIDRLVANVLAAKAATALFGADFGNGGGIGGIVGSLFGSGGDAVSSVIGNSVASGFVQAAAKFGGKTFGVVGDLNSALGIFPPGTVAGADSEAGYAKARYEMNKYRQLLGSYASGTDYVPRTGPYLLHQGERVTPASENRASAPITINMTVNTPNAASFNRSRNQIMADLTRQLQAAQRCL